ncbi:MAG TPA: hypothetical protein VMU69_10100, partial [Bradyrhizobium sp.]|nr:hypothetical protein [Bradyrhizobium sp.]
RTGFSRTQSHKQDSPTKPWRGNLTGAFPVLTEAEPERLQFLALARFLGRGAGIDRVRKRSTLKQAA